ncbi:MAG: helix-turn-helix transcriptional regulator [Eubacterium sp.]|nr:helix-turn-helix transcriptional regulator [Eubacterium sp.]
MEKRRAGLSLITDENGWGLPIYDGYLEFPRQDETGIAVLYQDHARTVMPHKHFYHELALIVRGRGTHSYQGEPSVPLLPGDVLLIDPHVEHSYVVETPMLIINCQFFTHKLNMDFNRMVGSTHRRCETIYEEPNIMQRWDELHRETELFWEKDSSNPASAGKNGEKFRRRGIISLEREEFEEVERFLYAMMDEQEKPDRDSAALKSLILQLMLTRLKRLVRRQNAISENNRVDTRQQKIEKALAYIEENISENLQVGDLAEQLFWSEGYFRNVFKEVTGFTPIQYINRKKILKSIDYIQKSNMNAQEAAERVGIYDPSYYSRLFKKYMGYSPRQLNRSRGLETGE